MTTTPIVNEGFTTEIVTFPRTDPGEIGTFVDLVVGCDFVCADEASGFGYSVQIDPEELHVQVEFPINTTPTDAQILLDNIVLTGSITGETRDSEIGSVKTVDERFQEMVERFGEVKRARERIIDFGSTLTKISSDEIAREQIIGIEDSDIAESIIDSRKEYNPYKSPSDVATISRSRIVRTSAMLAKHGDDNFASWKN